MKHTYLPLKATIIDILDMVSDIKLFQIKPNKPFSYKPGEFVMLSLWGKGEVPISITSSYDYHKYIELCIRRVGYVTSAIHMLRPADELGIRGPYGNPFPIENAIGKDILFIAGGLGLAPLRPLIHKVMNEKKSFKKIILICGSRNPRDILFKDDVDSWQKMGLHLFLGVRKGLQFLLNTGAKDKSLQRKTSSVIKKLKIPKISFKHSYAFVCGPPVMIDPTMNSLSSLGMNESNIFTSLEAHMKCGVGKCGHCNAYGKYVCTEGPVFSYSDIKDRRLYKY